MQNRVWVVLGLVWALGSVSSSAQAETELPVPEGDSYLSSSVTCGKKTLNVVLPLKNATVASLNVSDKARLLMSSNEFQAFIKDLSTTEILDCYWRLVE
jgi:DNA gyrase/topoisomerase IV subunit B